jgi:hypothetical protein
VVATREGCATVAHADMRGLATSRLTRNEAGEVYLLTMYAKSESENISLSTLKEIRRALEI